MKRILAVTQRIGAPAASVGLLAAVFSFTSNAEAKEIPVQGRLFLSSTKVDPSELNTEMRALGRS